MIFVTMNFIAGSISIALAGALWHHSLPVVKAERGRWCAVEVLMLGFALGLWGVGRSLQAMGLPVGVWILSCGHYALIVYCGMRFWRLRKIGTATWSTLR